VRVLRSLDEIGADVVHGSVTIGNFDGVHRGHARLVERLLEHAARLGGPAVVFTFDPHPVQLLRPEAAPPPLTWAERKAELLAELGVDAMIAYRTDEHLLALTPREFFDRVICDRLQARAVVEGPNFRFGRGRGGDVNLLDEYCRQAGIELEIVPPKMFDDQYISSSRIRQRICEGDVDAAREMLTRPYRVRGLVTHGARRGSGLGFPTANVEGVDTLLPALGVYAGRAREPRGVWPAAIHLGPNPTFAEASAKFEVHLIGYEGMLYGQPLEVDFLARLRDIRPFASIGDLKSQLQQDVAASREIAERFADPAC
jgi:riboflavin kinase / FMN adenylyltransferase